MTWVCHGIFQMMVTPSTGIIERVYAVQRTNIARDFVKSKIQQENSRDFFTSDNFLKTSSLSNKLYPLSTKLSEQL